MLRGTSRPPNGKGRFASVAAAAAPTALHGTVILRYLESAPIYARGAVTGRSYRFSDRARVQSVDARDAAHLLRTGFFRQGR